MVVAPPVHSEMESENAPLRLFAHGLTDLGRCRDQSEDAFYISKAHDLFIVSDGIGGAHGGALAAAATVQTLPLKVAAECRKLVCTGDKAIVEKARTLPSMIDAVKELLLDRTRYEPAAKGLGATVVAGFFVGNNTLALSHLGDSRAYLLRDGVLERLTEDHTVANMLFQTGRINSSELTHHPTRNILTRYIGMEDCPKADAALLRLLPGDRLLFCTDGLTSMISDAEIGNELIETEDCASACKRLVERSNHAGGHDNITVVVVDVTDGTSSQQRRGKVVVRDTVGSSLTPLGALP